MKIPAFICKLSIAAFLALAFSQPLLADVIASCGPMAGYTHYFGNAKFDVDPSWNSEDMKSTTIFLGDDKVDEVVIKSKGLKEGEESWTRSSKDYKAGVFELYREGSVRHVLVHWGPAIELYSINTETKTIALAAVKSGLLELARVFVGKCE